MVRKIKVLSLFDGISCDMVALERAGIPVERYVAYEIDKYAIKVSQKNYPQIEQMGDVTTADFTQYKGFDLLIGGSPCQDLCSCGSRMGLKGEKSRLFYEYLRALNEVKPKYFLLENNASMSKENQDIISDLLGVNPVMIDSIYFTPQSRKRLYWSNFNVSTDYLSNKIKTIRDIVQPIKEKAEFNISKQMFAKKRGTLAYKKAWANVRTLDSQLRCLTTAQTISNSGSTNIKYDDNTYFKPTPIECERGQTLPDNYTEGISNTQRYKCTGNGWTVDVIAYILKELKKEVS